MAKIDTPFRKALIQEATCAMNAVLGDVADELDEKMSKNPTLKLKDVMDPEDLLAIARKMEWYIFDEVKVCRKQPKLDEKEQNNKCH